MIARAVLMSAVALTCCMVVATVGARADWSPFALTVAGLAIGVWSAVVMFVAAADRIGYRR